MSTKRASEAPVIWGVFDDEGRLLEAIRAARRAGHPIFDVYSPYAVHGLEHEAGFRRSRLPRAGFAFGVFAVLLAFGFQYWASAVSWPLEVGNKPWNSWPAFVPVAFELTVLFAGVGTALVFLWRCRLWPGKSASPPFERLTNDRFALGLEANEDDSAAEDLLASEGALFTERRRGTEPEGDATV